LLTENTLSDPLRDFVFTTDSHILSLSQSGNIRIWDSFGNPISPNILASAESRAGVWNLTLDSSSYFLTSSGNCDIKAWDTSGNSLDFSLEGPASVIIDPNQDYIATHDNSGLLQLWDSNLRILPHQLKAEIEDISFSPTAILRTDLGGHSPIIKQLSVIGMGFN
jgi:WD40 repeat protein